MAVLVRGIKFIVRTMLQQVRLVVGRLQSLKLKTAVAIEDKTGKANLPTGGIGGNQASIF